MLIVSLLAYVATLVALILLAVWFVPSVDTCQTNFTLIFLSFLLVFFTTATPLHPKVLPGALPASRLPSPLPASERTARPSLPGEGCVVGLTCPQSWATYG